MIPLLNFNPPRKLVPHTLCMNYSLPHMFPHKVQGSREGVRKALMLVWSKEEQIQDCVVKMYLQLYLQPEVSVRDG